jgi:hypothetical protein
LTSTGNYSSEAGWSGSTGGYSGSRLRYASYEPEPAFQDAVQHSGYRTSPDVAFDANRNTGYWIYDSVGSYGWAQVGGTSAGPPEWAALVAIADQGRALASSAALANVQADVYSVPAGDFHDVTRGSNGFSAHAGYDLVTGLGTPIANLLVHDLADVELSASHRNSSGTGTGTTTTTTGVIVSVNIPINAVVSALDALAAIAPSADWTFVASLDSQLTAPTRTNSERMDQTLVSTDPVSWQRTIEATLGRRSDEAAPSDFPTLNLTDQEDPFGTTAPVFTEDSL